MSAFVIMNPMAAIYLVIASIWATVWLFWIVQCTSTALWKQSHRNALHHFITIVLSAKLVFTTVSIFFWTISYNLTLGRIYQISLFLSLIAVYMLLAMVSKGWRIARSDLSATGYWVAFGLSLSVTVCRYFNEVARTSPVSFTMVVTVVYFEVLMYSTSQILQQLTQYLSILSVAMRTQQTFVDASVTLEDLDKPPIHFERQLHACFQYKADAMRIVWMVLIFYGLCAMVILSLQFVVFSRVVPVVSVIIQEVADLVVLSTLSYAFRSQDQLKYSLIF